VARGQLLEELTGADPIPDLRRAVSLDATSRLLHVALIQELHQRALWQDALVAVAAARAHFPSDFNLALLDVRTLLNLDRAQEAIAILADIEVLPSESGRESPRLWEWAHTMAALDALDAGDAVAARDHLELALEWPESLGQGRPYEAEERLVRFVLGVTEQRLGNVTDARAHFEAVATATPAPSRLDLLAIPARSALGQSVDRRPLDDAPSTLFEDVEGRILRRALSLGEER